MDDYSLDERPTFVETLKRYASPIQWVAAANDGVIASAGVLEGFVGAGADDRTLMVAAVVLLIAGSFATGGATWAEEAGELDAERRIIAEEIAQLEGDPDSELSELADFWVSKGLSPSLARQVAEELSAKDALAAQLEFEHHIDEVTPQWHPVWAGITSALAFLVGALLPLLITVFVPVQVEGWAIALAVVASLIATSLVGARAGHMSVGGTIARTLTVGLVTLGTSYVLGRILL